MEKKDADFFRKRNRDIFLAIKDGMLMADLAKKYKVSITRIYQIYYVESRRFADRYRRNVPY